MSAQFEKLTNNVLLARFGQIKAGSVTIRLGVFAEMIETGITIARSLGRVGVYFIQVAKHGFDRTVQAVKIKTPCISYVRDLAANGRARLAPRPSMTETFHDPEAD